MTVFMTELIRLTGEEKWAEWGNDWWDHVERAGELPTVPSWGMADRLRAEGRAFKQLDRGALMFEVGADDLLRIYGDDARVDSVMGIRARRWRPLAKADE